MSQEICSNPLTLGDLISVRKLLWLYCRARGRERDIPPLLLGLPVSTPVPQVSKRLQCTQCGGRKIKAKPELYPGGIEAMRAKHRGSNRRLDQQASSFKTRPQLSASIRYIS